MTIQDIMTAIQTVGFPIVCCGALFWLQYKQAKDHKEEMAQIKDALNNNTIALTKLTERMDNHG